MVETSTASNHETHTPWWRSIGPALITACVVFGPGSLLISSNVGARYGYELLWLLLLTGLLMGTYMTTAARIGVVGGATPCTLVARRLGRPVAAVIGINLCLICTAFQFSNNLAVAAAADALGVARLFGDPQQMSDRTKLIIDSGVLLIFNAVIITLIFTLKQVYRALERIMKGMVALILICFLVNLFVVRPDLLGVLKGLIPNLPKGGENRLLFNMTSNHEKDLETGIVSEGLRKLFADHDIRISSEAIISAGQEGRKWLISDSGKQYTLIKEGDLLIMHKGRLLFSTSTKYESNLDIGLNSEGLRQQFADHDVQLSPKANISSAEKGSRWLIRDSKEEKKDKTKDYTIVKQEDKLNIYEGIIFIAPMILIASLLGTTFSVAGALYQGNLVREKGWTIKDYDRGISDSIAGVCVITGVSAVILITAGTVLRGQPANNIGVLATQLRPLLGRGAHTLFCIGLFAVAMNPFVINAMIGGSILADGVGKPAKLSDPWSRRFTVLVLLVGMVVAMIVLNTRIEKVDAIIFGAALTVVGNPLMAVTILWLANQKDIMGDRRNSIVLILTCLGLVVVVLMALRVLWRIVLMFS
ncbi:MAG: Nramp family divalent metal transporter [Planctomycetota bacterium]|jgi:Mn2+/Fe2+ NRAMP family transporter